MVGSPSASSVSFSHVGSSSGMCLPSCRPAVSSEGRAPSPSLRYQARYAGDVAVSSERHWSPGSGSWMP